MQVDEGFKSKATAESVGTVVLFVFVMFVLAGVSLSNCLDSSNTVAKVENRMMAPLPKFRLWSPTLPLFPGAFNAFYNDRFAYRQALISLVNYVSYKALSVSNSTQVVVGHHAWLFFLDGGDEETARHEPLFSQDEIHQWGRVLEARRAWLAARNIKFLFVIAPSKCSIYPEELPSAYNPVHEQSRQDQLLSYLKSNTKVSLLDLRQTLMEAKKFARLYYYTDTHWDHLGAFLAYTKIADRLQTWFPRLKPLGFADMRIDTFRFEDGDLQNMMGLHGLISEIVPRALPKKNANYRTSMIDTKGQSEVTHPQNVPHATDINDPSLPRAVCLQDSFMEAMSPLLSRHFSHISYYKQQEFPASIILREKPDVVIEELVERELNRFSPSNPDAVDEELEKARLANLVDKSKLAGANAQKVQ
jgi:alginate O-acetyltransferase complex protein AlgJ